MKILFFVLLFFLFGCKQNNIAELTYGGSVIEIDRNGHKDLFFWVVMKKFQWIVLLAISLSCENPKSNQYHELIEYDDLEGSDSALFLNVDFHDEIVRFLDEMAPRGINDSIVFVVGFSTKNEHISNPNNDTVVLFSIHICDTEFSNYKGVFKLNGYLFTVYDDDDFSSLFIQKKHVKYVPFGELFCLEIDTIPMKFFKVQSGMLFNILYTKKP
ncbi:MAG: hypothetical protein JJU02_00095 [Cryomorphaceae bacterium]|nr:hypothetical protein [Cryomorphaceae bacterium]